MNIQPHEYKPIVMRYLNGEATHEEEAMIDAFIKQGEEQAALFNQWMEEWEANIFSTPAPAVDQAWQRLQNAIDHAEDEETSPAHTAATPSDGTLHIGRTVHMQWWRKAVAAAAIIVIIGCAAIWSFSGSTATQTYLCSAPAGSKTQVTLPDGSKVWLNGGSSLAYTNQFNNDNRRVELHGEAYFEVQKQQGKPFTVHTQGYDVTVKGTKFNVSAYDNDPISTTTLMEGKVELSDGKQNLSLAPGDAVQLDKATGQLQRYATDGFADGWRSGRLMYPDITLEQFGRVLSRQYNVNVHLANRQCANMRISVMLQNNETIDEVASALTRITGHNITRNGDTLTIQ